MDPQMTATTAPSGPILRTLRALPLFGRVVRDYHITLNPGWQKQLGFTATPAD